MKTEVEIKKKREFLRKLIEDKEFEEELIMGSKQKAKLRIKINLLDWILGDKLPNKIENINKNQKRKNDS
ncbi:MAG TPA: hypothetical protein VMZ91_03510 [Candidatus Paceibacterota bacterium]|nr:hypothetical protein [Candidatus Paceibacterota bacterium]